MKRTLEIILLVAALIIIESVQVYLAHEALVYFNAAHHWIDALSVTTAVQFIAVCLWIFIKR